MAAAAYDLPDIEQGADYFLTFTYQDQNGTPVDLTGYTARMMLRVTYDDPTPLIELTDANGRLVLGGTAGTIDIHITATDTANLSFKTAKYDLELVDSTGVVTRLVMGSVRLSPEVTK